MMQCHAVMVIQHLVIGSLKIRKYFETRRGAYVLHVGDCRFRCVDVPPSDAALDAQRPAPATGAHRPFKSKIESFHSLRARAAPPSYFGSYMQPFQSVDRAFLSEIT
jgi:hypothetical protein